MYDVDYAAWATYLAGLMRSRGNGGRRVLEAACGTGSISLRLGKAGFDVLATDISPEMLDIAARRVRQAGAGVTFAQMEIRRIAAPPGHCVLRPAVAQI